MVSLRNNMDEVLCDWLDEIDTICRWFDKNMGDYGYKDKPEKQG